MPRTRTLLADLGFPEGPRWRDGRLWFSDFHDQRVRAVTEGGAVETVLELDDAPSGLGWSPSGELLVVAMHRRALLRVADGTTYVVAELGSWVPGPTNDMVVDSSGAAYVGNFGFDLLGGAAPQPTALLRVAPDGEVSVAAEDLHFPNGMCLTDGGRTLVVAETYAQRLTAYDVGADGALSGRRVFAALDEGVAPDGICLDGEGQVWVATARTPEVLRVREGGQVTARVEVGSGSLSFACALGGADGRTLFVCTAPSFRPGGPRAGRIEVAQVDVPAP